MLRVLSFISIILIAASPVFADHVSLYADAEGMECALAYNAPGVINIYVVVTSFTGATAAQFSAPLPDCWTGVTYLSETPTPPYIQIGNSQTGTAIAFGSCLSGPAIHILTIQVFAVSPDLIGDCCPYWVQPDPTANPPGIYTTDCSDPPNLLTATAGEVFVTRSGGWEAPILSDPYPPDGALDQPLDVVLEWNTAICSCGLGVLLHSVYFGTDPDPPLVSQYQSLNTYDPGTLLPETTYYWKIVAMDSDGGTTTGPVWSFTTESAIPIEKSSWGKIKSLYQ
jgi:hypothetical protein